MAKHKKKYSLFCLLALIAAFTACGDRQNSENSQRGIDGFVYAAELVGEIPSYYDNIKFEGLNMYYRENGSIYKRELPFSDSPICIDASGSLAYAVDNEQGVYCFQAKIKQLSSKEGELTEGTLTKYQADGTIGYRLSLNNISGLYTGYSSEFIAVDNEKNAYVLGGDTIYIVNAYGTLIDYIDISSCRSAADIGEERLLAGADGRIYYFTYSWQTGWILGIYEITSADPHFHFNKLFGENWDTLMQNHEKFHGSYYGLLRNGNDGVLYQYDVQNNNWNKVLYWSDSNLTSTPYLVTQISEDTMLAYFTMDEGKIYLLKKTDVRDLPKREELILASSSSSPCLEEAVIEFNQLSEQYHISIRNYIGTEGLLALDAGIVSSNPPDLLDMSSLNIIKYAEKEALEDLSLYLENSMVLKKEDFLPEIIEGYTIKEKLVCIPSQFYFSTLIGRASQIGSEAGWTLEDLINLEKRYPSYKLADSNGFSLNLELIYMDYVMEQFINTETGECRFDSKEFQDLLVWLINHSTSMTAKRIEEPRAEKLVCREVFYRVYDFMRYNAYMGGEMTIIGYPTAEGKALHHVIASDAVGIISRSKHKEGAWAFLEYFLSRENNGHNFPSRREWLEEEISCAAAIEYKTDINGKIILDQNGQPIEKPKYTTAEGPGKPMEEYGHMSEEETDRVRKVIGEINFTPKGGIEYEVMDIILDEVDSYYKGDKTLDEVTALIQNRAQILVQENLR